MILADTHILLWSAGVSGTLPAEARKLIEEAGPQRTFSVVSIWEVVIKAALKRPDFKADAARLRGGLIANGWRELAVTGNHALAVADLPPLHGDPFDRLLLAQARVEGLVLLTSDYAVARYGERVRMV